MNKLFLFLVAAAVITVSSARATDAVYVRDSGTLAYTSATAVVAGDVVVVNSRIPAVAKYDIAVGDVGTVFTRGVWGFAKQVEQTFSLGQAVYWDVDANAYGTATGTGAVTTNAPDGLYLGYAVEASATNAVTLRVELNSNEQLGNKTLDNLAAISFGTWYLKRSGTNIVAGLPTSDPAVAGALWASNSAVHVSAGP